MRKASKLIILISLIGIHPILAQDAPDFYGTALNLSRTQVGGTSRIQGLGGAQTALGGDISSISGNPAGLGFFNRSEVSVSMAFNYVGGESTFLNNQTTDGRLNLNFPNLGAVIRNSGDNEDEKYKGGAFGISINRIADLQNQFTLEGYSTYDDFAQFIQYISESDNSGNPLIKQEYSFDDYFFNIQDLALGVGLVGTFPDGSGGYFLDRDFYEVDDNNNYLEDDFGNIIPAYPTNDFPTYQNLIYDSRGAVYQTSFAYGGNYDDRFYFGGNIGILTMDQEIERQYTENPTGADLRELFIEDRIELSGVGINATIGVIGRPSRGLLLGASYTTPSIYGIEQIQSTTFTTDFIGNEGYEYGLDLAPFNYTVVTPSRLKLGASYFIGKHGFITGDVERINYPGSRLSTQNSNVSFSDINSTIDNGNTTWNYNIGGEFRYDIFRFRAGYAFIADPMDNNFSQSESRFSFGGGVRNDKWYADVVFTASGGANRLLSPYPDSTAAVERYNTIVSFTYGFFFQ